MDNNINELDALNLWPNKINHRIDVITPHKITIVFFVQEYIIQKQDMISKLEDYPAKYRSKFCMLLLKLIQFPDLPYKELYTLITSNQYGVHPELLLKFETILESLNSKDGIEMLFDLQKFIEKIMTENGVGVGIGVNQYGILGLYIRRIGLALDKLTFPEMMGLYKQIQQYYEKGVRALSISSSSKMKTPAGGGGGVNSGVGGTPGSIGGQAATAAASGVASSSLLDINTFMIKSGQNKWSAKQADLFVAQQCNLLENNETKALSPKNLQRKLQEIIQDNPLYSQAHILSYMNNLRIRDFFNSLDAFHRAFDRSAVRSHNPPETKGFQYSSLNLAIMHAQFDHTKEALASLRECIMLAQECGDRICLQLAQSWLCLLDKSNVQLCEKTVASQTELSLVHSVSLGVEFIVNVAAISGFLPSRLFELLMKSELINFQHSLMDLMSNCIAQKAAVWSLYGKNEIASLCSQLLLHVVRTHSKRENDSMENGEGVCHSLCCVSLWLALQGEFGPSAVILQHASERFPRYPLAKFWMLCDCYITSMQAMYKLNWEQASRSCCQLYTLDRTISILQRISLQIYRRNLRFARELALDLLNEPNLEPLNRVRTMIMLANSMILTPENISTEVVNVLNDAQIYAKDKYLAYEVAIIDIHFAYILLAMGLFTQSLKIIKHSIDTILADGGLYDSARTQFLFVKCLVATKTTNPEKLKCLLECQTILDECIIKFMKINVQTKVKDIYIYLAKMYNQLGLHVERNRYAKKFADLNEEIDTPTEYLNVFF